MEDNLGIQMLNQIAMEAMEETHNSPSMQPARSNVRTLSEMYHVSQEAQLFSNIETWMSLRGNVNMILLEMYITRTTTYLLSISWVPPSKASYLD